MTREYRSIPSDTYRRNQARKASALFSVLARALEQRTPYEALLQVRAMGDAQWQAAANVAAKLFPVTDALPSTETREIVIRNFYAAVQVAS